MSTAPVMTNPKSRSEAEATRVEGAAVGLGVMLGLIGRDLGRAIAIIGALVVATTALVNTNSRVIPADDLWKLFVIAGGIFVATAWICARD